MNKIGNFIRRLGKTRFLILCFIPFGMWGFYFHGLPGLLASMFGWWLGGIIYNWSEYKPRIIKFLQRRTKLQLNLMIKLIILIPIAIWCFWYAGWLGIAGCVIGWGIGELIHRRLFSLK